MKYLQATITAAVLVGLAIAPAWGEDVAPATAPMPAASSPATGEAMEITVTGIEGLVQVRPAEDQPWQAVKVGMKLDQGAEFRTGPRSAVRFVIPPDQTVTLDRLGTVKVLQAMRDAGKVKTDLGMKYGRTRYDIEAAGVEHESTIRGPGATLAVRGTKVSLYDQPPFAPEARSLTGRALFENAKKQKIAFGGKGRQAKIGGDQTSAAEQARLDTFLDAGIALARTPEERDILLAQSLDPFVVRSTSNLITCIGSFIATGAVDTIDVQTNRTRPVPGNLAFDLHWVGAADLDLSITSPKGEKLASFPIEIGRNGALECLTATRTVPSGGRIDFEDQGPFEPGAPSNSGRETAYWPTTYPAGKYKVQVNLSGGDSADLTVGVYQNGALLKTLTGAVSPASNKMTYTVKITKKELAALN